MHRFLRRALTAGIALAVVALSAATYTACSQTTSAPTAARTPVDKGKSDVTDDKTTRKHFGSFSGYSFPRKPTEPLSEEDAKKRKSYYVADYNASDQLVAFTKFIEGKRNWFDEYRYWPSGKLKYRKTTNSEGNVSETHYDEKGKEKK